MNIPVMQIFRESFAQFRDNKMAWVRLAFAPFVLFLVGFLVVTAINVASGVPLESKEMPVGFWPIFGQILNIILTFVGSLALYINGYRYGILNEGGTGWWQLELNARMLRLFLYILLFVLIVVSLVLLAVGLVFGAHMAFQSHAINTILGTVVGLGVFYTIIRLALLAPLVSVDHENPISTSWRLLHGNVLRLIGLTLLVSLKIIGIMLLGLIIIGLVGVLFYYINPVMTFIPIVAAILFFIYIWLLNWVVYTKALSLVLVSLTRTEA